MNCEIPNCHNVGSYRVTFRFGKSLALTYFCKDHHQDFKHTMKVQIEIEDLEDPSHFDFFTANLEHSGNAKAN